MKKLALAVLILPWSCHMALAADPVPPAEKAVDPTEEEVPMEAEKPGEAASAPVAELADFCFFSGKPPADQPYTIIRKLKIGKGTYGSVRELVPKLASYARSRGADAMIDYTGSQHFGFWPWRLVRPIVHGVAIKWNSPPTADCAAMGGATMKTIMETDKGPPPVAKGASR